MSIFLSASFQAGTAYGKTPKYQELVIELGGGDLERGVKHLEKLVKNGNGTATFLFANMFLELGDVQKFQKYLYIAADQGNPVAIKFIATSYFKGVLAEQSYKKARTWYEKGALLRNINSMVYLGIIFRDGLGVSVDYDKAYFWFSLAGVLKEDVAGQKEPEEFAQEVQHLVSTSIVEATGEKIRDWLAANPEIEPAKISPID